MNVYKNLLAPQIRARQTDRNIKGTKRCYASDLVLAFDMFTLYAGTVSPPPGSISHTMTSSVSPEPGTQYLFNKSSMFFSAPNYHYQKTKKRELGSLEHLYIHEHSWTHTHTDTVVNHLEFHINIYHFLLFSYTTLMLYIL